MPKLTDNNMNAFDGEKELIFRMDERIGLITAEVMHIKNFLESKVMTKDMCTLAQAQHDKSKTLDRIESMSKVFAIVSIAAGILWAVVRNT